MSELFAFAFSAAGILTLFAAGTLWMYARPGSRAVPRLLLAIVAAYLLVSTFEFGYQFERFLVRGFHPLTAADVPTGRHVIVVLGSGSFTTRDWDHTAYTTVDLGAAERVLEAARVYRLVGADVVISSGGLPRADDPDVPTGDAMRDALVDLGIAPSVIRVETRSRNTRDEALIVADMLKEIGPAHTILVTSARHMRRSIGAFKAAGIEVVPAIARNALLDQRWAERWLPADAGLMESRAVAHEYLGLLEYFGRGWLRR